MIIDLFHIVIVFVFLTILLLITIIYSKIWWQLKAVLIVFSVFFYLTTYQTMTSMLGRPTLQEMENDARILAYLAERPRGNFPGRIVMLVKDKTDFRLHQIPYDDKLINKLNEAQRESRKGGGVPKQMRVKRENDADKSSPGKFNITIEQPHPPDKKSNDFTK